MCRKHYTGIYGFVAKFDALGTEAEFQKTDSGVVWELTLLSKTGRRRKLEGEKHLLGWQESLWGLALRQ